MSMTYTKASLLTAFAILLVSCSASPQRLNSQIVGGIEATPNEYPFVVRLSRSSTVNSSSWFCGGSVIAPGWVVTAAHCLSGRTSSRVYAIAGDHTISDVSGREQASQGQRIFLHPDYNSRTYDSDIALLKLRTPLSFNTYVSSISVAALPADNTPLTVVGWGATREGGAVSQKLLKVAVPLQNSTACERSYPGDITVNMFCAGETVGGKDSCQGDSGGAIFTAGALVGVVSWGDGCARPNKYGVYTKAANFTAWIQRTLQNNP
jgi:trypsin